MPNLKSAKKRVRIEEKRRLRNHSIKAATRTFVTKARNAIAADVEAPETVEAVQEALSRLDRAASKGVVHKNNAARRKSRLMARHHKMQEAAAAPPAAKPGAAAKSRPSGGARSGARSTSRGAKS